MYTLFRFLRIPLFFLDADDGAGSGGGNDDKGAGDGDQDKNAGDGNGGNAGKTFTQTEVDDIVKKRLGRERKSWESAQEEERNKAQMTEAEKAKAEKEAAEKKAKDTSTAANTRVIRAEAKVQALAAGIKADRLNYALRMLDLSDIDVDDNGEPDTGAIKTAVEALLKDVPELKATAPDGNDKGGSDGFHGNDGKPLTDEIIADMSPAEMARRMPEIEKYYAAKRKK
ncbi:DUF4355 domain-containing protein [bacterium]|nr:DUF4355 domain-containing protein [bacterium]